MPIIPLEPNTTLHNKRYLIVRIIGYGGFGNTYLAFDRTFKNNCVVKEFALDMICTRDSTNATIAILHERENEMAKWLDKFTEEARNLALIRHIGVVNVFDTWREKGTAFYAMEHIEGGELPDSTEETWKPMAWTEAKKIAVALLEALQAVHKVGLFHGDIKPANILIDKESKLPILIDFGTARSLKKAQDKTATSLAYTAGYAPIELQDRSRSKETNSSSDLYSWAMVVIGLVKKHYNDGWPIDANTRIMLSDENLDKYGEKFLHKWLANLLPNSVISILANCLQLDSNQRPQSANVVLEQLKNSKQNPFYPQNQSDLNFRIRNENTILEQEDNKTILEQEDNKTVREQDDNKIVQEQSYENFLSKQEQNKSDFHEEKPSFHEEKPSFRAEEPSFRAEKTRTNNIIMFALIVGIIGIVFFFGRTEPTVCDDDTTLINGECVLREESSIRASSLTTETPISGREEVPTNRREEAPTSGREEAPTNGREEASTNGREEASTNGREDASTTGRVTPTSEREEPTNRIEAPEGFVLIQAGSFTMGSPDNEVERTRWNNDERPQHRVRITRSFYMQRFEVTQGEWRALMGNNPSHFSSSGDGRSCGSNCPVENVNWWEALAYANALSESKGLRECYVLSGCRDRPGNDMECRNASLNSNCGYRLPTEAEWEYAARAGTRTMFYNGESTPEDIAWYDSNSRRKTHPVGQLGANSWGLYDMSGNVREWCWDLYNANYYGSSPTNNPMGPNSSEQRILRGGSWSDSDSNTRSARRGTYSPDSCRNNFGFRLVSSAP